MTGDSPDKSLYFLFFGLMLVFGLVYWDTIRQALPSPSAPASAASVRSHE